MHLIVSNLPPSQEPDRFHALFGRYVYGFNSWTHCDRCLVARQGRKIHPGVGNVTVPLKDELFPLCGVGRDLSPKLHLQFARSRTNVHLAVHPRKGSVAAIGSVYGATFVIEDAEAIPIEVPTDEFQALANLKAHSRCKMFQFGYQMFDVDVISLTKSDPIHKLRPKWVSVPGITQDENGSMTDPQKAVS